MQGLQKYRIGIIALAVATLFLLVYVVIQSGGYKEDQQTNELASEIAEDLNDFISDNDEIPQSLSEATSKDVPETITYTNNDDGTYTFCVTYNSGSNGSSLDANSILYQGLSGSFADSSSSYESSYKASYLYVSSYSWNEGEQCEDIEPYIPVQRNKLDSNSFLDAYCKPSSEYYEYYKDYCVDGKYIY